MKPLFLITVFAFIFPAAADAQTRAWDLSADAGWLSSNKSDIAPDWDNWYEEGVGAASLGRYWTDHLKTEIRGSFSGAGQVYEEQPVRTPAQPLPIFRLRQHTFQKAALSGGVHYQFFDNQWFHPQLGTGLELERESHRVDASPDVNWRVRPFVTGGFKWYVTDRGFVRSDLRVALEPARASHLTWTAGAGVDLGEQRAAAPPSRVDWHAFAQRLEAGAPLRIRRRDGTRLRASFIEAQADAILVQPKTRLAVPAEALRYADVLSIERDKGGIGAGKAAAIGVAAGAGTFLVILLTLIASIQD
jgi:hypothetical protein